MKTWCLLLLLAITQVGCLSFFGGGNDGVRLNNEGEVVAGRNQYDSHAEAQWAMSEALQEFAKAAMTPTSSTIVTIDENNNPVMTCNNNVNSALIAASLVEIIGSLNRSQVPETAFAQGAKAVGGVIKETLNAPVVLATAPAAVVGLTADALSERIGDHTQNGDIIGSQNTTKNDGEGIATGPSIKEEPVILQPAPL